MFKLLSFSCFVLLMTGVAMSHPENGVRFLSESEAASLKGGDFCGATTVSCATCTAPSSCLHVPLLSSCFWLTGSHGCDAASHPECFTDTYGFDICVGCQCGNGVRPTCRLIPNGCSAECKGGGTLCLGCGC